MVLMRKMNLCYLFVLFADFADDEEADPSTTET